MHEFHTQRRVEFADTDMARIVHFSRFFDYMEAAEHAMLRAVLDGDEVHFEYEGQEVGWPRGRASCNFHSPAKLGDVLDIRVFIRRKGVKSLTYGFDISCQGRRVAEGEVTAICCLLGGEAGLRAIAIPAKLAARLDEAPAASTEE